MNSAQLQSWVDALLDRWKRGVLLEDDFIELKRTLPPARRAARRIAGLLNASRGSQVTFIVGIDEATQAVEPCRDDLASWISEVSSCFDGPRLAQTPLH